MCRAYGRIHKMLNTSGFGSICHQFALFDFAVETNIRKPEILYTKDAIHTLECSIKFGTIIQVACEELRAERFEFLRGWLVHITS